MSAGAAVTTVDATDVVGRRIGAILIDGIIFIVAGVLIGIAVGNGHSGGGRATVGFGSAGTAEMLLGTLAYFFVCEAVWGQTLGKRLLGIKVCRFDGGRPDTGAVLLRTVLRLVDSLPLFYIVGLVSVAATGRDRHQRVGDIAARTTVRRVGEA